MNGQGGIDSTQPAGSDQVMPYQGGPALIDREAEKLLAEFMDSVAKSLRAGHGDSGRGRAGEPDTEAMRIELRRYREIMYRVAGGGQAQGELSRAAPDPNRPAPTP